MLRALLFCLVTASATAQSAPDFSTVDDLIADSLDQIGGGASVLLMQDGEVIHRKSYGTFTPTTVVQTASGAKWLSGGVIASLISDGTLTLDDSLAMFFPSLTGTKRDITVRQLFSHTSGMSGNESGGQTLCILNRSTTLESCAETILARSLAHPPGTTFDYGANSMQVAGRVAEIATDESWVSLFEERIAHPLGMTHTQYISSTNPWIAGGMRTTADDYGAFLQMVLDGGLANGVQVLSGEAVEAMLADQTNNAPIAYSPIDTYVGYPGLPLTDAIYGIGVWRERVAPDGTLLDGSSPGAFGLAPWIDTERRVAGVLLVEDRLTDVMGTYLELKRLVREIVDGGAVASPTTPARATRLETPFPNPGRERVTVRYALATPGWARLVLTDSRGRRVAVLDSGRRRAGEHRVRADVRRFPSGAYRVVLRTHDGRWAQPLTLAR